MMKSPKLQLIDIPSQELELFGTIATLFRSWPGTRTVQITLFEHDSGNGEAALIKVQIGRMISNESWPVAINIVEWNYDHVSEVLEDWDTFLLYLATQCARSSLLSLDLNTSLFTAYGLDCMKRVLRQSDLSFFSIECGAFDPTLASYLGQVLQAVNWSSLKSLELFGYNVNSWIDLWARHNHTMKPAHLEVQLIRLSIAGYGGQKQRLSHSGALWLHDVIFLFAPVEVLLKNIEKQDTRD